VIQHFLPIEQDVFDIQTFEVLRERDSRIENFISSLQTGYEVGTSFERNIETFIDQHKVPQEVIDLVRRCICE
jgi:hypothetical protein